MRKVQVLSGLFLLAIGLVAGARWIAGEGYKSKGVEVYFSPGGGAMDAILGEIRGAKKSIEVAMFTFTNSTLSDALIQRSMNGVEVRIIFDANEARGRWSKARDIDKDDSKVDARRIEPELEEGSESEDSARFHHKFCVIDGATVITGSYNWTRGAEERNCEDVMILRHRQVAAAYRARFDEHWQAAKPNR